MKDIQRMKDEKEKMYKNYFQEKREDMLKQDEVRQLKFMNEKERIEAEKEAKEKEAKARVCSMKKY